mmetsp:Transcript_42199/g.71415  ORF Transcript_42199/g.71415 Transcript_42199/m.71415 type:complete len:82 (-) Transcript_42199:126-371(-)
MLAIAGVQKNHQKESSERLIQTLSTLMNFHHRWEQRLPHVVQQTYFVASVDSVLWHANASCAIRLQTALEKTSPYKKHHCV